MGAKSIRKFFCVGDTSPHPAPPFVTWLRVTRDNTAAWHVSYLPSVGGPLLEGK